MQTHAVATLYVARDINSIFHVLVTTVCSSLFPSSKVQFSRNAEVMKIDTIKKKGIEVQFSRTTEKDFSRKNFEGGGYASSVLVISFLDIFS